MVLRVGRNVYVIGGIELSHSYDNRVYVIDIGNEIIFFDSGSGYGHLNILSNLLTLGKHVNQIKYVILSHAHLESSMGAYYLLQMNKNIITVAFEPDSLKIMSGDGIYTNACQYSIEYKSYPITISLRHNEENIYKDIIFIKTPGHTKGSGSLLYDASGERIVLLSDALGPLDKNWGSELNDYIKSLEKLLELDGDRYCTSVECYNRSSFYKLVEEFIELAKLGKIWVSTCKK